MRILLPFGTSLDSAVLVEGLRWLAFPMLLLSFVLVCISFLGILSFFFLVSFFVGVCVYVSVYGCTFVIVYVCVYAI